MDDSQRVEFATAITAMLVTFGREATKPILHGYWLGLKDLSLDQVEEAVAVAMQTSDRVPVPAQLREIANGGNAKDLAIVAWGVVQRAMPLGAYRHVDFEDRTINAVIRGLGGWPMLFERCAAPDGEKWYRVDFLRDYEALSRRGVGEEAGLPLAGLAEVEVIKGEKVDPVPRLIGKDGSTRLNLEHRRTSSRELSLSGPRHVFSIDYRTS